MTASETGSVAWPGQFPRGGSTVSVLVATAIVVADMVGVGVFTSLGFQVKDIPSGFSILLLWAVGGIVALCGVFSYSELGAMFPRSSGEYNFLGRAFHPAFGFVAGWVSATVGFAAPVALAAMAFGEYGKSVLPGVPPLALAIGIVWLVSIVQLTGRQALQHLSAHLDRAEGRADRRLPDRGIRDRHAATGVVYA
jgi:Amino acid transporters